MNGGTYACALDAGFTPEQAGMLARLSIETKSEAIEYVDQRNAEPNPSMRKRLLRALFVYSVDMCFVLTGWLYGFGMSVQNWPVLLGFLIFARFFWHSLSVAIFVNDAKAAAKKALTVDEDTNLIELLDSAGIPEGPLCWRVREYRMDGERNSHSLLAALEDCALVMENDLAGLAVIQPELRQAKAAIARALENNQGEPA